jgi:putative ABC transport system permease protein
MHWGERIYRRLLHLYPREFRDEYGDEMSLLFRERAAEGRIRLCFQVLGDLLFHAPREHWNSLTQDVRFAFRQVRRSPGFSAVVVVTLALGIGGTTAVFSVLQAVLLAPLPYEDPGQLVRFYQQEPDKPGTRHYLTAAHFKLLRDQGGSFESVTAINNYRETGADLIRDGHAERVRGLRVSSGYFHTLRSPLARGAGFERRDEIGTRRGSVVGSSRLVLSSELWKSAFRGDPSVVGSTIQLSGEPFEVIGVAAEGFEDPIAGKVDAWAPYDLARDNNPENNSLSAVGRLKSGVSLNQARQELASLSRAMKERWPSARLSAVDAVPLHEDLVMAARGPLHLVVIAVGLVLLVACVNVANLVLARTMGRANEFAVRLALGSGSRRIVRQMLVESLVLACLGGLMGLTLATIAMRSLRFVAADALPRLEQVRFDPVVLGFAALVTLGTAVAFGVAPAFRLARTSPVRALRQQQRSTSTRAQGRLRNGLAAAQLALALTLLIGASVLVASFYRLQRVDLGFRVENVLTFEVNLPSVRYDTDRRVAFQEELARRLRAVPGVVAAGGISFLPATGSFHGWNTAIVTGPRAGASVATRDGYNIQQRVVSGDFFEALSIPMHAGRMFDARDDRDAPARTIVSANFARVAFPGMPFDHVIGQRIAIGDRSTLEIVGVAGDTALDPYGTSSLVVYHPHRQFANNRNWALSQVVAANVPQGQMLANVRATVRSMDPELVVYRPAPMTDVVGRSTRREQFALVLMTAFAVIAVLLAAVGLYGVLAYAVRQRTQEIGVRIALGATAAHIHLTILRQAGAVIGVGVIAGTAGALMLGHWLTTLAFGVSPSDPRIILAAVVVLTLTGLLAAWVPSRRAARVEPKYAMQEGS